MGTYCLFPVSVFLTIFVRVSVVVVTHFPLNSISVIYDLGVGPEVAWFLFTSGSRQFCDNRIVGDSQLLTQKGLVPGGEWRGVLGPRPAGGCVFFSVMPDSLGPRFLACKIRTVLSALQSDD